MNSDYSDYINNATKTLVDLLSSGNIRQEEKELYVTSLTDNYTRNVFSPEKMEPYDLLFAKESLLYIDGLLSNKNILQPINTDQLDDVLLLCERQNHNIDFFTSNKIPLPAIVVSDINHFCESVKANYDNNCFWDKTLQLDSLITETRSRLTSYNDEECTYIFSLLDELDSKIAECKSRRISVDKLRNKDTDKIRKAFAAHKQDESDRKGWYDEISKLDNQLLIACNLWSTDPNQLSVIVSLCDRCESLINNGKNRGWPAPALKCNNPIDTKNRYLLYNEISKLDKQISTLVKTPSEEQHKQFLDSVNKQRNNILYCSQKGWTVPALIINDLDGTVKSYNRTISQKRRNTTVAIVFAAIGLFFVFLLSLVLFLVYRYSKTHAKIPVALSGSVDANYLNVVEELEDAGFINVNICSVSTGLQASGVVTEITVDGKDDFSYDRYYSIDEEIIIFYSSKDRIDLTPVLRDWDSADFNSLVNRINKLGFNVDSEEISNSFMSYNNKVATVSVNGVEYISGDCFVPADAKISISYYDTVYRLNYNRKDLKGKDYQEVRKILTDLGFDNIKFVKKNDLINGKIFNDGSVANISINDDENFESGKLYSHDAEIVITVHTYPDRLYKYIDN